MQLGPNDLSTLASSPNITQHYFVRGWRTNGTGGAVRLGTLHVPAANSTVCAIITHCSITFNVPAAIATPGYVRAGRNTVAPTGGTNMTAVGARSDNAAVATIVKSATASDGGVATAITAALPSAWIGFTVADNLWVAGTLTMFTPRPHPLIDHPVAVLPGEAFIVDAVGGIDTNTSFVIQWNWIETRI